MFCLAGLAADVDGMIDRARRADLNAVGPLIRVRLSALPQVNDRTCPAGFGRRAVRFLTGAARTSPAL